MTIRDVPDETRDELAARAARAGQSLQEYVRAPLTELARRPNPADLWDRVEHRVRATGTRLPAAEILDLRDHDRTWRPSLRAVGDRVRELHPTVTAHAAAFVPLAEELGASLWTLDRRLADAPGPGCTFRTPDRWAATGPCRASSGAADRSPGTRRRGRGPLPRAAVVVNDPGQPVPIGCELPAAGGGEVGRDSSVRLWSAQREKLTDWLVRQIVVRVTESPVGTEVWQARISRDLAAQLQADSEVLGLSGRTEIVKAALQLLHQRAAEERMARSVAEFYGDEEPPLPIGVVAEEPNDADPS